MAALAGIGIHLAHAKKKLRKNVSRFLYLAMLCSYNHSDSDMARVWANAYGFYGNIVGLWVFEIMGCNSRVILIQLAQPR